MGPSAHCKHVFVGVHLSRFIATIYFFLNVWSFGNAWPPLLWQCGTEQHVFGIFTLNIMFITNKNPRL